MGWELETRTEHLKIANQNVPGRKPQWIFSEKISKMWEMLQEVVLTADGIVLQFWNHYYSLLQRNVI